MSKIIIKQRKNKKKIEFIKNCKFIEDNLIRYKEYKNDNEFYELMKNGYIQMSQINLELTEGFQNEYVSNYEFDGISEYEKWLCGV